MCITVRVYHGKVWMSWNFGLKTFSLSLKTALFLSIWKESIICNGDAGLINDCRLYRNSSRISYSLSCNIPVNPLHLLFNTDSWNVFQRWRTISPVTFWNTERESFANGVPGWSMSGSEVLQAKTSDYDLFFFHFGDSTQQFKIIKRRVQRREPH